MRDENSGVDSDAGLKRLQARVSELEAMVVDRREVEKSLRDQLQFLNILIETIPNQIFFKDKEGKYLGCNKAFERRVGLDRGGIIGKTAWDIFPKDIAALYEKHDADLFERPGEKIYEARLTYPDEQDHDFIVTKAIFTDSEGKVSGLVGVTVDITERKQTEEALQRAHDELEGQVERRTAALAEANRKLEQEVAARSRIAEDLQRNSAKLKIFAYSIAHDLKSPSIGVYGLARLLQKNFAEMLGEKGAGFCNGIMKASEHMAALVDGINQFIAAKETPLKIEAIDMKDVFRMLRDEFSARLKERRIALVEPSGVPAVRADKVSILRVFRNLIDNAVKYGGDGLTAVEIGYEESDDFHYFMVKDDGVGIQAKDSGEIFDLFKRLNASDKIEGTGLGLAIVKEIIERHKGQIGVEPGPEGGTVFKFSIPKTN